jgi:phospholipid/cholesterol/gamma-HCH transport system substrate-binding protein
MKKTTNEFKIGLTVLIALGLLLFGILWGKQVSLTSDSYKVDIRFRDIAGLEPGAPVLVNGVNRGRVTDLILQQEGVIVRLALVNTVTLYNDAKFEISTPELMSAKVISISPGISGVKQPSNYVWQGEVARGMSDLMKVSADLVQDVKRLLNVLEVTATNINETAGDPHLRQALLSSVNNLEQSSQRTLEFISVSEGKFNQVVDNLVVSSDNLKNLLASNTEPITAAIADVNVLTARLNNAAFKIDAVMAKLQTTDGTLGTLINDEKLVTDLQKTVNDLDSLIIQIREQGINTHISLFGRKKK